MRVAVLAITIGGCNPELLCNPGFDLQCGDGACAWEVVEGEVTFESWHPAEPGLDLSASDRAVVRQRLAPDWAAGRDVVIEASVALDPGVSLWFEFAWYGEGPGWNEEDAPDCASFGPDYSCGAIPAEDPACKGDSNWERDPRLLDVDRVDLRETGAFRVRASVSAPSVPGKDGYARIGLLFSIVKEGPGLAIIDEVSLFPGGE